MREFTNDSRRSESLHVCIFGYTPNMMNAYDAEGTGQIRMTLHSGERIDVRAITPEQIRIEDIAHALANICRFTGHVPEFYSVAQHCLIVVELLPRDPVLRLQALLHDATEAYLTDVSHFLKHSPEMAGYRVLESELETKIMDRFRLPATLDPRIKVADKTATQLEWTQMMHGEPSVLVAPIVPLPPGMAKSAFLWRYRELSLAAGRYI